MTTHTSEIIYTKTDEAPALATYSLLPIIQAFTRHANLNVTTRDISLAARIIASFPEKLPANKRISDDLDELGGLAKTPDANIIKLPNISASIPQLQSAIKELRDQGYDVPLYPATPSTDEERDIQQRYAKVLGSAVNPVLREGNSDRRVAPPVKEYARNNPHSLGAWSSGSKAHVSHMNSGDFYASEQSVIMPSADDVRIELVKTDGETVVLKPSVPLQAGEVIDSAVMSCKALRAFFEEQINEALQQGVLLSLHLKATMMKVSDPIMFGHAVSVYFSDVFEKHADTFAELGVNPNNGFGDVISKIEQLPDAKRAEIEADIAAVFDRQPPLAMVDSDKGITNLHVPNDIIVDASMPAAIRVSGQMWAPNGSLHDTKAMIPDRCYATLYDETITFCKQNGAFDVTTMGNVSNVGLMAQKAEEYGSHDKTFEIPADGSVRIVNQKGDVLMEHAVEQGDIFRMCQTKDLPIRDWVKLGVTRARVTGNPAIFWLDEARAHDRNLIGLVNTYLNDHDTDGLDIKILSIREATRTTLAMIKEGKDVISVTGNVLRDYLTDLFPILELGTSAKMLSIVPLLAGGGLYETGAGGSAPKHAQQLISEGHLRWDSLGEFLALAVSLEEQGRKTDNAKAIVLANTLNKATGHFLAYNRSPLRKVGELDSRGSHFYLTLYWAEALSEQNDDAELKACFKHVFDQLENSRSDIVKELSAAQGKPVDVGGYYYLNDAKAYRVMRPSNTLNNIIDAV